MKKTIFLIIAVFAEFVLFAQTERDVYKDLRSSGLKSLEELRYADALWQLEAAQALYDCTEIQQDIKRTNDSIDLAFSRAKNTYYNVSKLRAIEMFRELKDLRPESYAYIGQYYYLSYDDSLARKYFEKGVGAGDQLSALRFARMLRKKEPKNISRRITLYKNAISYEGVYDSLGVEYERLNKIDSAYIWFSKSTSAFSKYNRASLLLDPENRNALSSISDDPIKLLEDVANNKSGDFRGQAAYYLGMLYRYRSKTKGDEINKLGWQWIERAANWGHSDAKRTMYRKDKYVK